MNIYATLLIVIGIIIVIRIFLFIIIQIISDIDYKRQLSGKHKMRVYKGDISLSEELYNSELEIEKASKDILTKNEISHRL